MSKAKNKLIAELRLIIDKYEDSSLSSIWYFTEQIKHILDKPAYEEE
tara:strand:+ start:454 stop:594 length:141 start_codon:yes stop_codon:yes gene_type:complete